MRRPLLALALTAAGIACLTAPVSAWPPGSISSWSVVMNEGIRGIAVGPNGDTFVLNGQRLERYLSDGTFVSHVITGPGGALQFADDLAVDSEGRVYVADTYASRIQIFDGNLEPIEAWSGGGLSYPVGIEVGPNGDIYVMTQTGIQVRSASGTILESWGIEGATAMAVDSEGNVIVTGWGLFKLIRSDGMLLETMGGRYDFGHVEDLVVDDTAFFVNTGQGGILAFDHAGIFRGSFWSQTATGLTKNSQGYLVAADTRGRVTRFGPVGALPPAPPPPPQASSAVILHIGTAGVIETACEAGPTSIDSVVTQEAANRDGGADYFVYLLAMPRSAGEGILGVQCGIDHQDQGGGGDPLVVHNWVLCADFEIPGDDWPASGTGNTITWVECDFRPLAVAGYLFVTAYGPSIMSVVPYPQPPHVVKTANCDGAENVAYQDLGLDHVGWVSMGGGAIGLDADGCNPALEPCASVTVPVETTTWGRLKTLYGTKP